MVSASEDGYVLVWQLQNESNKEIKLLSQTQFKNHLLTGVKFFTKDKKIKVATLAYERKELYRFEIKV